MKKIISIIKKHPIICAIILAVIIIFVIPFFINLSYRHTSNLFATEWDASAALGFYGSVLSFVGTVFLGALSLYQNHIIRQQAEEHQRFLEKQEHDLNMPNFDVIARGSSGGMSNIRFILSNITKNPANHILIDHIQVDDEPSGVDGQTLNMLPGFQKQQLQLGNPPSKKGKVTFEIHADDMYGERHNYYVEAIRTDDKQSYGLPEMTIIEQNQQN